ncbi:diaminopimelate epimerase [Alteribacillus persepolensis]|uniref:Diaminopimelate epimerase n=1 Tax=Alteribacillus persepolensis TaxID=568899 RepID=A0A1G8DYQ9_9BACI|nr:diaminopimelate epimerase [Alteribacillus persepolensis]SDH62711.1 diaminopimelate epimerase [Alteribacillus persepolensis]
MKFTKMHGLGNSYIYVNVFEETLKEEELPELAVNVSNKNTGIGSDGMILIGPSETEDIQMRIFNADGSEAKNCGNGLRSVAKYAYENQLVKKESFTVETLGGAVKAHVYPSNDNKTVERIAVDMGAPRLYKKDIPMKGEPHTTTVDEAIEVDGQILMMTAVSMGNPHAVFFVDNITQAPVEQIGPLLEKDDMFPESANIEFVEMVSENEMHFRVWERGSGITQACGTGACAAVVAAILTNRTKKGIPVTVHLLGGDLEIIWTENNSVWMTGPAVTIGHGEYKK